MRSGPVRSVGTPFTLRDLATTLTAPASLIVLDRGVGNRDVCDAESNPEGDLMRTGESCTFMLAIPPFPWILHHGSKYAHSSSSLRRSGSVARTNLKKNMSRSLWQNSASPPHCIMSASSRPLLLSRTRTRPGARSWRFALAGTYMRRSRKGTCH